MTTATPSTRRRILLPVILLAVVLAAGGFEVYREYFQTYHLATVAQGVLYRDGCHSIREFGNGVRRSGIKTVVSLIDANEANDPAKPQLKQEEAFLAGQKVNLVRIPVTLGGWPRTEDVQRFLQTVSEPGNRPVLVHCAQGVRRTGMFVAAYQMSVENVGKDQAKAAIQAFGHSERTIEDVRTFIDAYDPRTQEVSPELTNLKPSGE